MDQLQLARRKRELYIGPWLPKPIQTATSGEGVDPQERVEMEEPISLAFLLLLEELQPFERAVFPAHVKSLSMSLPRLLAYLAKAKRPVAVRSAGLLAMAVQGLVVLAAFSCSRARHLARLSLPFRAHYMLFAQQSKLVGITLPAGLNHVTHAAIQEAITEWFVTGFRMGMLIEASLALGVRRATSLLIEDTSRDIRCNVVVNGFPSSTDLRHVQFPKRLRHAGEYAGS